MTLRPTDTIRIRHADIVYIQKICPPLKNESMADWLERYTNALRGNKKEVRK